MADKKCDFIKCTTPPFRVSFPALHEPKRGPDGTGELKYSVRMLFPKEMGESDAKLFKTIVDACGTVANQFWGEGKHPKNLKKPRKDGDDSDYANEKGHWILNARTTQKVGVVDQKRRELIDEEIKEKLYAGCWARATILVGATNKAGNNAVYLILQNVQFLRDDSAFGNRKKAVDDFEAVEFSEGAEDFKEGDEGGF
jgi:hypothetical protein